MAINKIQFHCDVILSSTDKLKIRIKDYTKKIAQITAAGTTQAKFYIKKDVSKKTGEIIETYYLLHPMHNGERRKEYVGRYEPEIRKAQERMARYKLRSEYIDTRNKLETRLVEIENILTRAFQLSCTENLFNKGIN